MPAAWKIPRSPPGIADSSSNNALISAFEAMSALYVANPGDRRTEARQFLALGPRRTASGDDHLTSAVRQ